MREPSSYRWCVIVPTYNNERTLANILERILVYTHEVIVINDGSTDRTREILQNFPQITVLHQEKNSGKGAALRKGFTFALDNGYEYAITIDSDGQHFPEDIPNFLRRLEEKGEPVLLLGARNMSQEGIPRRSSFGNKFSNFWFWFETGIRLEDTQSGFRLYPLSEMPKKYYTPKFEFEIESIVRAAWKGIPVENIPVQVHYQDRVSHFRPVRDFARISVLNTILVTCTLLYIKPRDFFRNLKKKELKQFIKEEILESSAPPHVKALSMALGVFWGIVPLWGFQTLGVIGSAYALRLNKMIAFGFSNISLPPFIPIIILASIKLGTWLITGPEVNEGTLEIEKHLVQYIVGGSVLALVMSSITGILGYIFFRSKVHA